MFFMGDLIVNIYIYVIKLCKKITLYLFLMLQKVLCFIYKITLFHKKLFLQKKVVQYFGFYVVLMATSGQLQT